MTTSIILLRRVETVDTIPDGVYKGFWGGYSVHFSIGATNYEAQTKDGISAWKTACLITVRDGHMTVEVVS